LGVELTKAELGPEKESLDMPRKISALESLYLYNRLE